MTVGDMETGLLATNMEFAPTPPPPHLETSRGLEPKCVAQLILGSIMSTGWSAIGKLFPLVRSNSPGILCES